MSASPISIKLRCASWPQLASIHKRDLSRKALFLKTGTPPAIGTLVKVALTLPSATVISLTGTVALHISAHDPGGRGPGIDIALEEIPPSAMWIIENALASEQKVRAASASEAPPNGGRAATSPVVTEISEGSSEEVDAEAELCAALEHELESLRKMNAFQVLGVGYESGDAEVRSAFADLTKRYHPDRFTRFNSEVLRKLAAEIFILIRDAYRRLGDGAGRAAAMAQAGYVPTPRPVAAPRANTAPVPPIPKARASTAAPIAARVVPPAPVPPPTAPAPNGFAAGPAPIPRVRPPTNTDNSGVDIGTPPPAISAAIGTLDTERKPIAVAPPTLTNDAAENARAIEALLDAGDFEAALTGYKLLAKKNPSDRTARAGIELCEGLRALAARDRLEAAQRFETVLEIDPSNEHAARELADMRRQATNERKGLLTKLMNKKD